MPPAKLNGLFRANLLRITFFSGLMLTVLTFGALVFFETAGRGRGVQKPAEEGSGFYHEIKEWDKLAEKVLKENAANVSLLKEAEDLDRALDKLEKKTEGLESVFSVLKRRRRLAYFNPRFARAYRESARRARKAYPYSEPVAAAAASAFLFDTAVTRDSEPEIRSCLSLLADPRFYPLRLGIPVLLGDFKNAQTAQAALPADLVSQSAAVWRIEPAAEAEKIAVDLAVLKILKGDTPAAAVEIDSIISDYSAVSEVSPSISLDAFIRFAAEFHYDFGDMLRSAELFSRLQDEAALSRQADALWLGGYTDSARNIWRLLSGSQAEGEGIRQRSLYNLAASAQTREEAAALLQRLAARSGDAAALGETSDAAGLQFGLIRYSRFFDAPRAVAILQTGAPAGEVSSNALLDLEILKRRTEIDEPGRLTAETWMLLGRYSGEENLYRWAAWYFDLQRNYTETAVLLKNAARRGFSGQWLSIHEGILRIREGSLDSAEEIFSAVSAADSGAGSWPAAANLGRLLEARHSPARAVTAYETAAALVQNREAASNIQLRIAHCLKTLDRAAEARRVLEYALNLNPGNLSARLELDRLR